MNTSGENWDLKEPERIDIARLKGKSFTKAAIFAEERLNSLSNLLLKLINEEQNFLLREKDTSANAFNLLQNFTKHAQIIIAQQEQAIQTNRQEIDSRNNERMLVEQSAHQAEADVKAIDEQVKLTKQNVIDLTKKKKELAEVINTHELAKIHLADNQAKGNDLFIWFLLILYGEPRSKYAFKNFRKEVWVKDKGVDFTLRIKGFKPKHLNMDDANFTKAVIEQKNAIMQSLTKSAKKRSLEAVEKLYDFVNLVFASHNDLEKIKELETQLEEATKNYDLRVVELDKVRSSLEGYQIRISLASKCRETYLQICGLLGKTEEQSVERAQTHGQLALVLEQEKANVIKEITFKGDHASANVAHEEWKKMNGPDSPRKNGPLKIIHAGQDAGSEEIPEVDFKESVTDNAKSCQGCNVF